MSHGFPVAINPNLLGFDFDGVIADTAEAFLRLACEEYGRCDIRLNDITDFTVEECLDMDPQSIQAIFTSILLDSIGTGLQPMAGAVEVLGQIAEKSTVTVVTARPKRQPVVDWLNSVLPPSTAKAVQVVAMGAHDDKPRHITKLGLQYFIDDRAETCNQIDAAGIGSIVFHQPWNHGRHNLPTVESWDAIGKLCCLTT